jgi:hypothetical protein
MRYLPLCLGAVGASFTVPVLNLAVCALVGYRYPHDLSPLATGAHETSLFLMGILAGAALVWVQFVRQQPPSLH